MRMTTREEFAVKIIAFEEHFKLPAIHQANKKANDPVEQAYDTISKSGHFVEDPKNRVPSRHL
jgi:hypothetical protein